MITVKNSLNKLCQYCKNQNWIGYDPYDGLNSKLFQSVPIFNNFKLFRLVFLQLNKKSPINLRSILNVDKGRNPKAIGLFLSGAINLYKETKDREYLILIEQFIKWLKEDISSGFSGNCWGYNFDWQSRAFFLPKGMPTVVNTCFISLAFLSAFDVLKNEEYLKIARSACDFILYDLNRLKEDNMICFSYSPLDHYFVNNATALASSLLGSVYGKTGERKLADLAKKSISYVINNQKEDGSWRYGENKIAMRVGIDNIHTGFILESVKIYSDAIEDKNCIKAIKKGLDFYQKFFFNEIGAPKYYHNKTYPIDTHSAAQAIITLINLKNFGSDMKLCSKVVNWMINNMQNHRGYFDYQKGRFITNKIQYMRWSQAWAFKALTSYLASHEQHI